MDKCGNISILLVVFVSLKMTRYEWKNVEYVLVKYFSCQAIVTDFNNHRLLVIKSNFCSAQVFSILKIKDFLSTVTIFDSSWGAREPRTESSLGPMVLRLMMRETSLWRIPGITEFRSVS